MTSGSHPAALPFDEDRLEERLMRWLKIDSVTPHETAFLHELEETFAELGYVTRRQAIEGDRRFNLLATRGEVSDPRVLYSTHVDTVPPHLPVRREGGAVYGRGACDTKGGLLAMMHAAERLLSDQVGFLLVVGEEVDHVGAKRASELGLKPAQIILCEPTVNRVVAAQKGMIKIILSATGVAAHSAYPARGDSALHRLIDALHALRHAEWPVDERLGPSTLNVGMLQGGVAANVFAPQAEATLLMRTVAPTARYLPLIRSLCSPHRVQAEILVENGPVFFEPPEDEAQCVVAFNTDATYLEPIAPVWLVGPGDIEVAHTDQEHIDLSELRRGIDLYERLGRSALERG